VVDVSGCRHRDGRSPHDLASPWVLRAGIGASLSEARIGALGAVPWAPEVACVVTVVWVGPSGVGAGLLLDQN
jgi:hypothetical protein